MKHYAWILSSLLGLLGLSLSAQSALRVGVLPQVNLNYQLTEQWRLNAKLESRPALAQNSWSEKLTFDYALTDFSVLAAYKFGSQRTLSGGYLWRWRPREDHHRLIQQYSMVSRLARFRLGHRFAADQTFRPNEKMELRLRYRLSMEFPFNGTQVDDGEWYLKLNHEYLHAFQGPDYDLEVRLVPVLGWLAADRSKVETGLDLRTNGLLHQQTRWTFFWAVAWYYSI